MTLSLLEREAIVLQVVVETIQAIVNREVLEFSAGTENIQVAPKSSSQLAMFNVLLADLLEPVDPSLLEVDGSLIAALGAVCETPQLGSEELASRLQVATHVFRDWLEHQIAVYVWLPSINFEASAFKLRRRDFISICGKHLQA